LVHSGYFETKYLEEEERTFLIMAVLAYTSPPPHYTFAFFWQQINGNLTTSKSMAKYDWETITTAVIDIARRQADMSKAG